MKQKDIASIRNVLRYIATSDRDVRDEVLRLDVLLERMQQQHRIKAATKGDKT